MVHSTNKGLTFALVFLARGELSQECLRLNLKFAQFWRQSLKSKRCCSNHLSSTKFGSYLQSTTCTSLFCFPSNLESSESWFALYLSLFELFSRKSWSQCLKATRHTFQSSELTTDLTLYSTRTSKIELSPALYLARLENTHVHEDWLQVSNSIRHVHKTLRNLSCQVRMTCHTLFGAVIKRICQLRLTTSLIP